MELSLVIEIALGLIAFIGAFLLVKFKTNQHDKDIESILRWQKEHSGDNEERINAGFKRLDATIDRVTVLEQNTKEHLDLSQVEDKFVTRKELHLHLEKIELTSKHTSDNVEKMTGKLEDLMQLLSSNVVKTLSGKVAS